MKIHVYPTVCVYLDVTSQKSIANLMKEGVLRLTVLLAMVKLQKAVGS